MDNALFIVPICNYFLEVADEENYLADNSRGRDYCNDQIRAAHQQFCPGTLAGNAFGHDWRKSKGRFRIRCGKINRRVEGAVELTGGYGGA